MTRAERIEEYKQLLDDEIELLRTAQETEQDANEWLRLDNAIDALLIHKDNASAEIDAALAEPVVTLDYTLPAPKVIKMMDENLGSRFIISGGEVLEIDESRNRCTECGKPSDSLVCVACHNSVW